MQSRKELSTLIDEIYNFPEKIPKAFTMTKEQWIMGLPQLVDVNRRNQMSLELNKLADIANSIRIYAILALLIDNYKLYGDNIWPLCNFIIYPFVLYNEYLESIKGENND